MQNRNLSCSNCVMKNKFEVQFKPKGKKWYVDFNVYSQPKKIWPSISRNHISMILKKYLENKQKSKLFAIILQSILIYYVSLNS